MQLTRPPITLMKRYLELGFLERDHRLAPEGQMRDEFTFLVTIFADCEFEYFTSLCDHALALEAENEHIKDHIKKLLKSCPPFEA